MNALVSRLVSMAVVAQVDVGLVVRGPGGSSWSLSVDVDAVVSRVNIGDLAAQVGIDALMNGDIGGLMAAVADRRPHWPRWTPTPRSAASASARWCRTPSWAPSSPSPTSGVASGPWTWGPTQGVGLDGFVGRVGLITCCSAIRRHALELFLASLVAGGGRTASPMAPTTPRSWPGPGTPVRRGMARSVGVADGPTESELQDAADDLQFFLRTLVARLLAAFALDRALVVALFALTRALLVPALGDRRAGLQPQGAATLWRRSRTSST